MPTLADAVFDAALTVLRSGIDRIQLRAAASSVLVDVDSLSSVSALWSSIASGSSGGRKLVFKSSIASLQGVSVSAGGSIAKLAMLDSATVQGTVDISGSPVNVGSSDQVNIGGFTITLADPA